MSGKYIIAHDVGTRGSKAVLTDPEGRIFGSAFEGYEVDYPQAHWAEQEPEDWWRAVTRSTKRLLTECQVSPEDVLCMIFSTQMLGIIPVDAEGTPLRPGIIWLDGRAGRQAKQLMRKLISPRIFAAVVGAEATGKDVLPKLMWLQQNEPALVARTHKFLDVNGYLVYRSTGRMVADWTAASVTGLFNLKSKKWDDFLIRFLGAPGDKFPELLPSNELVGGLTTSAARDFGLLQGTPIVCGVGDAPGAAVGSGAVGEGEGHIYLGTSGWVGVVTEKSPTGRYGVATIQSADPTKCFLIAETETAGICLQWIADQFYRREQSDPAVENVFALMDAVVEKVEAGSGRIIFTPWMYGERSPVSDVYVRSTFLNLSCDHQREHMLRAVYEGVAYNLRWILEIMSRKFGWQQDVIRVIGGGARGDPWLQIIADVTGKRVEKVANPRQAGAVGAALVAAIGLGVYPDFQALKKVIQVTRTFEPRAENAELYDELFDAYKKVYRALKGIYRQLNQERLADL
ncbi:MAG: FGGY-family carbohydrate kinase [Anaerolineae bacterium]|nr:FGGY-family carbohydrate kinase [Anaerolineae bacterium]